MQSVYLNCFALLIAFTHSKRLVGELYAIFKSNRAYPSFLLIQLLLRCSGDIVAVSRFSRQSHLIVARQTFAFSTVCRRDSLNF